MGKPSPEGVLDSNKNITVKSNIEHTVCIGEIIFAPSQGIFYFIDTEELEELTKKQDTYDPETLLIADDGIDYIAENAQDHEEKVKMFNKLMFGVEADEYIPLPEEGYAEKMRYTECVFLGENYRNIENNENDKPFTKLISNTYLESLKADLEYRDKNNHRKKTRIGENRWIKLLEAVGKKKTKDIFEKYKKEIESEEETSEEVTTSNGKTATKETSNSKTLKLDEELNAKFTEKWHGNLYRKQVKAKKTNISEEEEKKKKGSKSRTSYKGTAELAKDLLDVIGVEIPSPFKEYIEAKKIDLVGKWETSVAVLEGERDYNNKESKKRIIELLKKKQYDPEAVKKDVETQIENEESGKETDKTKNPEDEYFTQDDADKVIRKIFDLWGNGNFEDFIEKVGPYTPNVIFRDQQAREDLQEEVNNQEVPPTIFDAHTDYGVLRAAASASGKFKSDISSGKLVEAEGEAEARAALAEGKAEVGIYLPNEDGHNAELHLEFHEEQITYRDLDVNTSDTNPANFAFDSSIIGFNTAYGLLDQLSMIAEFIGGEGDEFVGLDVIGHTDAVGKEGYNMELGKRRAEAAYAFLKGDTVGLAQEFQKSGSNKAVRNKAMLEHMQAVVNLLNANNGTLPKISAKMNVELPGTVFTFSLDEALKDPELINEFFNDEMPFESQVESLKQQYPEYAQNAAKPIQDLSFSNRQDDFEYMPGQKNSYILELCRKYRNGIINYVTTEYRDKLSGNMLSPDNIVCHNTSIISKGESQLKVNDKGRNLANRRVELIGNIIDKNKTKVLIGEINIDFGNFRLFLHGYASGFAGAKVKLAGAVSLSVDEDLLNVKGTTKGVTAESSAELDALAGAEVEAGLKARADWKDGNEITEFLELGSVGYSFSALVGAGVKGEFKIGYDRESHRFKYKMEAKATLGAGCGGSFEFTVGLKGLWMLAKHVYYQIEKNDFSFVDIFIGDAFPIFNKWFMRLLQLRIDISETKQVEEAAMDALEVLGDEESMDEGWKTMQDSATNKEKEELENLLEALSSREFVTAVNSEMMNYLTPELKGRILYILTQYRVSSWWQDLRSGDLNSGSENAAVNLIVCCIKSKRDWQETFEHLAEVSNSAEELHVQLDNMPTPIEIVTDKKALPPEGSDEPAKITQAQQVAETKIKQKRMEMNELWLKTNLLNNWEKWEKVMKKKEELFT